MLIFGTGALASDVLSSMEFDKKQRQLVFFADKAAFSRKYIIDNYRVLTDYEAVEHYFKNEDAEFIVAVGDNQTRENISKKLERLGGKNANYISEHAFVSRHVKLAGSGLIVLHNAFVGNGCVLGEGAVVYLDGNIGHDCILSKYVLVSGNTCMADVEIGSYSYISMGVSLKQGIEIGEKVFVGIGSVVNKDIQSQKTVVGNPAKAIKTT